MTDEATKELSDAIGKARENLRLRTEEAWKAERSKEEAEKKLELVCKDAREKQDAASRAKRCVTCHLFTVAGESKQASCEPCIEEGERVRVKHERIRMEQLYKGCSQTQIAVYESGVRAWQANGYAMSRTPPGTNRDY